MTPSQRLRLAAAIAHSVPGAELRLSPRHGRAVVVGRHLNADVDPCPFRAMVVAAAASSDGADLVELADHLGSIEIGGAIVDTGGGIWASSVDLRQQRWIASFLPPHRLAELIDAIGLDTVALDAMHACLKPDPLLAVTVAAITAADLRSLEFLDDVVASIAATCMIEELRGELSAPAGAGLP
jgi:hypothetical protein